MKRVKAIGGIFFKARDPEALKAWYRDRLGVPLDENGYVVMPWPAAGEARAGYQVWSPFPADTKYFEPSAAPFMVNFIVDDLHALLTELRAAGCRVDDKVDDSEFGKFGWVLDPEGNRVELWEPPPK
ncbi:MAG TPA: VOC family protein [Polyangia bacterium]|nr:VOC family protein [Polyangia bacterium]